MRPAPAEAAAHAGAAAAERTSPGRAAAHASEETGIDTRLLLIRHGETAWNAEGRIQGQLDVPLSPRGIWQAGRLADRLAAEPIDAVVASDLARAWLTAQAVADARRVEAIAEPRLRERHFGRFQGHTLHDIAARWPEDLQHWRQRTIDWPIPGGESAGDFIGRVLAALTDVVASWRGGTVAVIAHGGALDVAYRHARGLPWDAPREHVMLNAAVNRVRARLAGSAGEPGLELSIEDWGDASHLDGARDELAAS